MKTITYTATYRGQEYILSLRVCDDGYISNWESMAVNNVIAAYARKEEQYVDAFFGAVVHQVQNNAGVEVPTPWASYNELDVLLVRRVMEDFFDAAVKKIDALQLTNHFTAQMEAGAILGLTKPTSLSSTLP